MAARISALNVWLIVDDHPLICTAIAGVMQQVDRQACCSLAHSVASGLEAARTYSLYAAMVDLELTDGHGSALVSHPREQPPGLPILVLSGNEKADQVRRLIVSVPRTPSLRYRRRCADGSYAVATAAPVPGSMMALTGRQLCGSSCARSRFFSVGRRSKTSLR